MDFVALSIRELASARGGIKVFITSVTRKFYAFLEELDHFEVLTRFDGNCPPSDISYYLFLP